MHEHSADCGCHDHEIPVETISPPPEGAGIVDIVTWSIANDRPLPSLPKDAHFCGTRTPGFSAGMVTPNFIGRPQDFASDFVLMVLSEFSRESEKAPIKMALLSSDAFVVTVTPGEEPEVNFYLYDAGDTLKKMGKRGPKPTMREIVPGDPRTTRNCPSCRGLNATMMVAMATALSSSVAKLHQKNVPQEITPDADDQSEAVAESAAA
jgi:hypothetical protein